MRTLTQQSNRCCTAAEASSSSVKRPRSLHAARHKLCGAATATAAGAATSAKGFRRCTAVHQRSAAVAQLVTATGATAYRKQRCSHINSTPAHHAEGAAAVPDLDPRVYTDPSAYPEAFVGPIKAVHIPGKGRGLIATQPLQPGQLLLVTPPLALVEGDTFEIPDHDELQEVIASSGATFTAWQAEWLAALISDTDHTVSTSSSTDNGSSSSRGSAQDTAFSINSESFSIPDMIPPEGESKWYTQDATTAAAATDTTTTAAAAAEIRIPFESLNMSEERLWAAIVLNCYGESCPDLPASLCSGVELSSQLGLWGPFSLLNHSCRPNAVNYTLRDSMVVRAAAAVAMGEEVCINYLGRGALQPLSQRQQELELCYGFKCNCPRCVLEAQVCNRPTNARGVTIEQIFDSILKKLPDYEVKLQEALAGISECSIVEHGTPQDNPQQQQQGGATRSTDHTRLINCTKQLKDLIADMQQQWEELMAAVERSSGSIAGSSSDSGGDVAGGSSSSSSIAGGTSASDVATAVAWLEASVFDLLGLLQEAVAAAAATTAPTPVAAAEAAEVTTSVDLANSTDAHAHADLQSHSYGQLNKTVLTAMLHIAEAVCPGSDLHVFHALRWTSKMQAEQGKDSAEAAAAFSQLANALRLRYGVQVTANEELLQRMVLASSKAAAMVSF